MYFDDSSVFTRNVSVPYFVYGGIYFTDTKSRDKCKLKYRSVSNTIKKHLDVRGELKACKIRNLKYKQSLLRVSNPHNTLSLSVQLNRVHDYILDDKKSIHRYKDYILKRLIKEALKKEINQNSIDANQPTKLIICVDEQPTSTNGIYDLKSSIYEELRFGVSNFDYGIHHPNIFHNDLIVEVQYCDSSKNWLIQQSDIIANRVWSAFASGKPSVIKKIPNHQHIYFP